MQLKEKIGDSAEGARLDWGGGREDRHYVGVSQSSDGGVSSQMYLLIWDHVVQTPPYKITYLLLLLAT